VTAPGEPTSVGSIIGYLILNRSAWDRSLDDGVTKARASTSEISRLSPKITIDTNADTVSAKLQLVAAQERAVGAEADKAKPFVINLWAALAAAAPAAVPIAGVLTGALIGLLPVAAAVTLGVKGIENQWKSTALQGTVFASDVNSLKVELTALEQTAGQNLLGGLHQGISSVTPLFQVLNTDIGNTSAELGQIVAHLAPALTSIFTQMQPLFDTFGLAVEHGAVSLEHWAQSSTGMRSFVAYTQAELPHVLDFLGQLVTLLSHITQAAAPFGGVMLNDLTLFVHVLNDIPLPVLQQLIPLLIEGYAAAKLYQAVTPIFTAVKAAVNAAGKEYGAFALQLKADAQQNIATVAQEAAEVTAAKAAEAEAAATANAAIIAATGEQTSMFAAETEALAASVGEQTSLFATEATAAAASSAEVVAALQAEAIAAAATAEAETAAAAEMIAAAKAASASWTLALGPLAILAAGVGLLALNMHHASSEAQQVAKDQDSYSQSLRQTTDALAAVNIAQTQNDLAQQNAFTRLDRLNSLNHNLGLSYNDLTLAVNGSAAEFNRVAASLINLANPFTSTGRDALDLLKTLGDLRTGLAQQTQTQDELNAATEQSLGISGSQTAAAAALYGLTGTAGVQAYLAVTQAEQKAAQQSAQNTLQMQMENNAAGLLKQALDALAGKNLSYAQAENTFEQSLITATQAIAQNGTTLQGLSQAAITNRGNLDQLVTSAEAAAEAYGQMKDSSEAGRQELIKLRQQIIDNAAAHREDRKAVTDYIGSILQIPESGPTTKLDINNAAAEQKLTDMQAQIDSLHGRVIEVDVSTAGVSALVQIGHTLDRIQNGQETITQSGGGLVKAYAGGGGLPQGWAVVGEEGPEAVFTAGGASHVFSNPDSRAIFASMGTNVPGFADGTTGVVSLTPPKPSKAAAKIIGDTITAAVASGAVVGTADVIKGDTAQVTAVARELSAAVNDAFTLKGVEDKLTAVKADLANLTKEYISLDQQVTGTLGSSVDASKYTDIGSLLSAYGNQYGVNAQFATEINKLHGEGLDPQLLQQLISRGPSAGLDALAAGSAGDISRINTAFSTYSGSAAYGGQLAANIVYGKQLNSDQAQIKALGDQQGQLLGQIEKLTAAIGHLTNRAVVVSIDNKPIVTAVIKSNEFQGVVDSLDHHLTYTHP
jgi:hypothetical protein